MKKQQAIVIFIKNKKKIDKIRIKYDPYFKKFKTHITIVYRFRKKKEEILYNHIRNAIKEIKSFKITLQGYGISEKEHYLYLSIKEGRQNVMKLHKALNSGILKNVKNKKVLRYIPHLTLGIFKTKKELNKARRELPKNLKVVEKVDRITLLTLDKNKKTLSRKSFKLK